VKSQQRKLIVPPQRNINGAITARHWIGSGLVAVLTFHFVCFAVQSSLSITGAAQKSIGASVDQFFELIYISAVAVWLVLPIGLILLWRAACHGAANLRVAILIGIVLPAFILLPTFGAFAAHPPLDRLTLQLTLAAMSTGASIGALTWIYLKCWKPEGFDI
jgi:hypothetical protein